MTKWRYGCTGDWTPPDIDNWCYLSVIMYLGDVHRAAAHPWCLSTLTWHLARMATPPWCLCLGVYCCDYYAKAATGDYGSVAIILGSYTPWWLCCAVPPQCLSCVASSPLHPCQRAVCVCTGGRGDRFTPGLLVQYLGVKPLWISYCCTPWCLY